MGKGEKRSSAVLITATDSVSGVTCVRSLGSRGIHTIVATEIETAAAFSSRYCDEAVVVPSPREDLVAYKDALLSIARRSEVRTIVPTREEDAYVLARYKDAFEQHVTALWPPFETLSIVHDRLRLAEAAEDAGVPVPETRSLGDVDDWDGDQIVKPRYSLVANAYVGAVPPNSCDRSKAIRYLPQGERPNAQALASEMRGSEPIVQEYVPSDDEYAFVALYDEGTPVTTYQKRHIRGKTYAGGPSVYRESVAIPELREYGESLLNQLEWHGIAEVQFLRDTNTGKFALLEINPFFWGSIPCAVRAGADFPYYYWLLATGDRDRIVTEYELGIATHFLYGELNYLASVLRDDNPLVERPQFTSELWDVVSSMIESPYFDHLDRNDPRPFVRGVRNALDV